MPLPKPFPPAAARDDSVPSVYSGTTKFPLLGGECTRVAAGDWSRSKDGEEAGGEKMSPRILDWTESDIANA